MCLVLFCQLSHHRVKSNAATTSSQMISFWSHMQSACRVGYRRIILSLLSFLSLLSLLGSLLLRSPVLRYIGRAQADKDMDNMDNVDNLDNHNPHTHTHTVL